MALADDLPAGPADAPPAPDPPDGATEWPLLDRLDQGAIGARRGDAVRVRCRERPGCVLYGPSWQLHAGNYRLLFDCRAARPRRPAQPVLGVEIIAANRLQHAWRDFTAAE